MNKSQKTNNRTTKLALLAVQKASSINKPKYKDSRKKPVVKDEDLCRVLREQTRKLNKSYLRK